MAVTVNDNGWSLLKARLARTRPRVKVGIFGSAAAAKANDSDKTVGQIANAHEHGLGVPRRSWLADTVDANQADIVAGLRKAAAAVIRAPRNPGLEVQLLDQTGQHIAGLMRQRISSGIAPALSEGYLPRKLAKYPGATTPLIASGQMWESIGSVVEGAPVVVAAQRAAARKAAKKALARRRRNRKIARARKRVDRLGRKASRLGAKLLKRGTRSATRTQRKLSRVARKLGRKLRGSRRRRRR